MRTDNRFLVGPVVTGDSFIGGSYHQLKAELIERLLRARNSVSLVGLPRMGKTSLMQLVEESAGQAPYERVLPVWFDMNRVAAAPDMTQFDVLLASIVHVLKRQLAKTPGLSKAEAADIWETLAEFEATKPSSYAYRLAFTDLFQDIATAGWRVLLTLDEFDSAREIFTSTADFELFRDLTQERYGVSLAFISRRQLYMIEKKNYNNSTFHGAVKMMAVPGFTPEDIAEYEQILQADYEVALPEAAKARLHYYAGRSPYIYSAFGERMAALRLSGQSVPAVDALYEQLAVTLNQYAATIFGQLEEDGDLAKLAGTIIGPSVDVTPQDVDDLRAMGYLDRGDEEAVSGYFTAYMRNRKISGGKLWDNFSAVEIKIKALILKEVAGGRELSFDAWTGIMSDAYREYHIRGGVFNPGTYKKFIENDAIQYHRQSTMLDVMSLQDAFNVVHLHWLDKFAAYFGGEAYGLWITPFSACGKARNSLAHNHEKYYTENERALLVGYCQKILQTIHASEQAAAEGL